MNGREPNDQQKKFVSEYLVDQNAKQAAIRSGYSPKSAETIGFRLLEKPHIRAAIDARLKKITDKIDLSSEYVLKNLMEVTERCMQRAPVMVRSGRHMVQKKEERLDENGELKTYEVWEFDSAGATKALELLGKHLGMFKDKVEHSGKINLLDLVKKARGEE